MSVQHGEFQTKGLVSERFAEAARARLAHAATAGRSVLDRSGWLPVRAPTTGALVLCAAFILGPAAFEAPAPEASSGDVEQQVEDVVAGPARDDDLERRRRAFMDDELCDPGDGPTLGRARGARLVVTDGEWQPVVYDVATGRSVPVAEGCHPGPVSFRSPDQVTYVTDGVEIREQRFERLIELDLRSGTRRVITVGQFDAIGWEPGGRRVAWVSWLDHDMTGTPIFVHDVTTGVTRLVATLSDVANGRCGWIGDEHSISWSPDGSMLAVTWTAFDNDRTLRVIDVESGSDVIEPRGATFARWLSDDELLYRVFEYPVGARHGWYRVALSSSKVEKLAMRADTFEPAVSPSRKQIATHSDDGRLWIHSIEDGSERRRARNLGRPHWLDDRTLVAPEVRPCETMCYSEFEHTGLTAIIDVRTGERRTIAAQNVVAVAPWSLSEQVADPAGDDVSGHDLDEPPARPSDNDEDELPLTGVLRDVTRVLLGPQLQAISP